VIGASGGFTGGSNEEMYTIPDQMAFEDRKLTAKLKKLSIRTTTNRKGRTLLIASFLHAHRDLPAIMLF